MINSRFDVVTVYRLPISIICNTIYKLSNICDISDVIRVEAFTIQVLHNQLAALAKFRLLLFTLSQIYSDEPIRDTARLTEHLP